MTSGNRPLTESNELSEIVVGQDVLELLSCGMHIDPMSVYREYIQNAADAVDSARATGMISAEELGRVDIMVDQESRTVRVRDNGCGLPFWDFARQLTAIGGSVKRGTSARGFRGVGRLAGLAYAQELVFRSRGAGEDDVSELKWDCRQIKETLREGPYDASVADLVRRVTTIERTQIDDAPDRFFEVEMRGIVRLKNDRLMSSLGISQYLSQVAPVPFAPGFRFGTEISQALAPHVDLRGLDIRVGDADEPIYRPHRGSLSSDGNALLNFDDMAILEIPSTDEGVAAIAWILHHEYSGAIPTAALVKGLRFRVGNIQVGGHALLEDLFTEPRFNSWTVGEVHVIDSRLVPNGRRDHFEHNGHFYNLLNHLAPTAREISRRCRTNSVRRKSEREFEQHARSATESISVIAQGSTSQSKRQEIALATEQTILRMCRIASKDLLADTADYRRQRIRALRALLSEAMHDDDSVSSPLTRLSASERTTYEHFFELVYECSTNRAAAKALVDRILLRIARTVPQEEESRLRPARLHVEIETVDHR